MTFETHAYRVRTFLEPRRGFGWCTQIDNPEREDQSEYANAVRQYVSVAERLLREGPHGYAPVPSLPAQQRDSLSNTPLGQEFLRFYASVQDLAVSRRAVP